MCLSDRRHTVRYSIVMYSSSMVVMFPRKSKYILFDQLMVSLLSVELLYGTRLCHIVHPVESPQSHCIHTMSHWSSGLPVCFPSWGTQVQSPGGYLCETRILLLVLSRYIDDPEVIDHCGLVWGGLRPEPSLGLCANNVIIQLDFTQLFCPGFMLAAGPPSGFTTDIVGCWGGALWRACNLTAFIHCLTGPVDYPFASHHEEPGFNSHRGYLCETRILLLALSRYNLVLSWGHSAVFWRNNDKTSSGKLEVGVRLKFWCSCSCSCPCPCPRLFPCPCPCLCPYVRLHVHVHAHVFVCAHVHFHFHVHVHVYASLIIYYEQKSAKQLLRRYCLPDYATSSKQS
jgi:hypothetical protein